MVLLIFARPSRYAWVISRRTLAVPVESAIGLTPLCV
jgi:hypothetical protein